MLLDIDTPIRYEDGEQIGTISKVIYDPTSGTVNEIVLDTADLLGRRILVPLTLLRADPGDVLTLDAGRDEVAALPDYVVDEYIAAPEGWEASENYAPGEDLLPATAAYTLMPVFEESNAAPGTIELSQGTEVRCADDRLGIVDKVVVADADGQLQGLVVRPDDPDSPLWLIPPTLLGEADGLLIMLNCTLADLPQQAQPYQEDPGAEPEPESLVPST
jgi:sporulation protein YlmC with PRC-barrel domain